MHGERVVIPLSDIVQDHRLVILVGRKSSGKDTLGGELASLGWSTSALADPLKDLCGRWFHIPDTVLRGPSSAREAPVTERQLRDGWQRARDEVEALRELFLAPMWTTGVLMSGLRVQVLNMADEARRGLPITARTVLQRVGTDWGRALDPDVWVRAALNRWEAQAQWEGQPRRLVLTDGRFRNEALAAKARGAMVAFLEPGDRVPCPPVRHASEPQLADIGADTVDFVVDTSGDNRLWYRMAAPGTIPVSPC